MEIDDTLEFLVGTWELTRVIEDHRSATSGVLEGVATFLKQPSASTQGRVRYDEVGELRFGGHEGPARRSLGFERLDDGLVLVSFEDGRAFVDLDLRGGAWCSEHLCGADRYEITTTVRSAGVLEERWRVRGPAKEYDATTTLTRGG